MTAKDTSRGSNSLQVKKNRNALDIALDMRARALGNRSHEQPLSFKEILTSGYDDIFVADDSICTFKVDMVSMEMPLFSLTTQTDHELWAWSSKDGCKTVEVAPGFYGRASQHDKDVLIYCISKLVAAQNEGKQISQNIRFKASNFFAATRQADRGGDYARLRASLNRLAGTQITTNVVAAGRRVSEGFALIDSWQIVEKSGKDKDRRMEAVQLKLSDWLFGIVSNMEVLTISPDYFSLRKPMEKRLYEIGRKHVGYQGMWEIGIDRLRDKTGSTVARLRQFRNALEKIIEEDKLPDFRVAITATGNAKFYSKDVKKMKKSPKSKGDSNVDNSQKHRAFTRA